LLLSNVDKNPLPIVFDACRDGRGTIWEAPVEEGMSGILVLVGTVGW
jgi:hypothetical protein